MKVLIQWKNRNFLKPLELPDFRRRWTTRNERVTWLKSWRYLSTFPGCQKPRLNHTHNNWSRALNFDDKQWLIWHEITYQKINTLELIRRKIQTFWIFHRPTHTNYLFFFWRSWLSFAWESSFSLFPSYTRSLFQHRSQFFLFSFVRSLLHQIYYLIIPRSPSSGLCPLLDSPRGC